ncbi:MAG: hypothetical protein HY695_16705 [Deltaproteobacteria bacterium]|nr:hypothetical protein [Deltaproteobacteria bacterium]
MITVLDGQWLRKAKARTAGDTWVDDVLGSIDAGGGVYLSTLRAWFDEFPLRGNKNKRAFKARIESFANEDHLGAVNEVSWWKFMERTGLEGIPLQPSKTARPDFYITSPSEFFCEVSTLNVSDNDKRSFRRCQGIDLDHRSTMKRLLLKVTREKQTQIAYGAQKHIPSVLVLFDYTTWSGFATEFYRYLAKLLLGSEGVLSLLPKDLSALVYIERKVLDGRIVLSRDRSAVYYNPSARHALPFGTLPTLIQFSNGIVEVRPNIPEPWWQL